MMVVLDTNVILAGLRSSIGASRMVLAAVGAGAMPTLCNVAMMLEYEEVLQRPENLAAIGWTAEDADRFLDELSALVVPVPPGFRHLPLLRDADDETFLEAAINGNADVLLTFNVGHFRETRREDLPHGVVIERPADFLRRIAWRPSATTRSAFRLP
jgi:putative PIN family toxin of toxin-antitoxin system